MRALFVPGLILSLVAGCAAPRDDIRNRPLAANPSAFVAAEIAFARLAQDKGQWTAFRETSAPDAVMFVPQRVKARDWLKSQTNPAEAVKWQPHAVYVSCDGNSGVTTGAWQKGPANGYFTTVWLRDERGRLSWILDHGDALATPRAAPDFIETKQAACSPRPAAASDSGDEAGEDGADRAIGLSRDHTLGWTSTVRADQSRRVTVRLWNGTGMATVIDDQVGVPAR